MKNGKDSTELKVSGTGIGLAIIAASCGFIDPDLAAKIGAGIIAFYTIGRSIAKLTPTPKDDLFFQALKETLEDIFKNNKMEK